MSPSGSDRCLVPPDPVSFVGQRSTGTGDRHRGNSEECDDEVVEVEVSGSRGSTTPTCQGTSKTIGETLCL